MNVVEANTCRRDPLEQGDFFDHILSKRSGKLEKRRSTANAMHDTIAYMVNGRFQLVHLVIAVIHATYVKVGKAYIEHILERTGGLTTEQMEEIYDVLWAWLSAVPLPDPSDLRQISDWGKDFLRKTVIDRLTGSIYDMAVVNFPKSYPTLSTLRNCMISVQEYGREKLVNTLIDDVESKLLHIAVDTPTILNGYSLCVESLRELDPSCVIMHRVCKVIKEYLKKRPDTVRQIINYITSEKRDDLAAHLCIPVSACVISSHFWPKIVSETVSEFPAPLEEALVEYEKSFMDHKESRKLQWMRAVGCVEVTLKLGDVEVDKVVPNPIAAVLYLYLEKGMLIFSIFKRFYCCPIEGRITYFYFSVVFIEIFF
ncbi:hypothetical protein OESDEN_10586 [Oesophagostomum dentatum]|uniref:Cullin family profile domain-containing protein n=1 Tax=Oesophagostomum dentatum TaxID=61180 RepID=A0A0B1T088_OESDE|nr:hypothetical protein OESDEN_10586 [Oesophagostomum dentatum]